MGAIFVLQSNIDFPPNVIVMFHLHANSNLPVTFGVVRTFYDRLLSVSEKTYNDTSVVDVELPKLTK